MRYRDDPRMSKHTPGPWYVAGDTGASFDWWVEAEDCGVVALMATTRPPQEQRANAHLLATAPELLEALRRLTAFAASHTGGGCTPAEGRILDDAHSDAATLAAWVATARAAIAKATGE